MAASDPTGGGGAARAGRVPADLRAEPWWNDSLLVSFSFRCNLACTFCMVEDVLDVYEGTSIEAFRKLTTESAALRGVRRIIFSGGEVTLAKGLLDYVALARTLPGIEHVRVQTNGMRLGDPTYLRALLDAGVDELFISIHAPDAALCDAITGRSGSFEGILAGMRAVARSRAALFTNTAIVQANHRVLPEIVELVAPLGPRSMEFWNYWPRGDEAGARRMNARVSDSRGPLLAALAACVRRGIPPVVKWYPRCLLGEYAPFHDNGQPPSILEDGYWDRAPDYGCLYEGVCLDAPARPGDSTAGVCAGLSEAYVHEHGWEEDVLLPRRAPREGDPGAPGDPVERSLLADAGARRSEQAVVSAFLARLGLAVGQRIEGWELSTATRARAHEGGGALALTFAQGDRAVLVRLHDADPARRCALRSRSFDISYQLEGPAPPRDESAPALLRALLAALRERDPGGLRAP